MLRMFDWAKYNARITILENTCWDTRIKSKLIPDDKRLLRENIRENIYFPMFWGQNKEADRELQVVYL